MRRRKIVLLIKLIIPILIIFLGALFIITALTRFLKTSDYFAIKDIIAGDEITVDLSYLKGQNIFTVDLRKESRYLSVHYPVYSNVRLVRILPNRIFVNFIERKAVALVKLYRYFAVDEEGLLFDNAQQLQDGNLPLIYGLETKIFGPKSGTTYNIKELTFALHLINTFNSNRILRNYKIKNINVANPRCVLLFMGLGQNRELEIRLGEGDISKSMGILADIVNQGGSDLPNTKYIDLRFKEPVIKMSNAK